MFHSVTLVEEVEVVGEEGEVLPHYPHQRVLHPKKEEVEVLLRLH